MPAKKRSKIDEVLEVVRGMRAEIDEMKQERGRAVEEQEPEREEEDGRQVAKPTDEVKGLLAEVKEALVQLKEGKKGGRGGQAKEEILTAHAVAKKWTKWVDYVLEGESEAACISRIDLLIGEIRVQFDLTRLAAGGLMEGMAEPAIAGIVSLLAGVARGSGDPRMVETALEAFRKQLTTAQRVETHSADSAVALAAAMREVQPAIAGMPAGLRVPRWRAAKDLRRAGRWPQGGIFRGGRGGASAAQKRGGSWEDQRPTFFRPKDDGRRGGDDRKPGNGVGGVGRA